VYFIARNQFPLHGVLDRQTCIRTRKRQNVVHGAEQLLRLVLGQRGMRLVALVLLRAGRRTLRPCRAPHRSRQHCPRKYHNASEIPSPAQSVHSIPPTCQTHSPNLRATPHPVAIINSVRSFAPVSTCIPRSNPPIPRFPLRRRPAPCFIPLASRPSIPPAGSASPAPTVSAGSTAWSPTTSPTSSPARAATTSDSTPRAAYRAT